MRYKCKRCGDVIDEEDLKRTTYYEDRGEFWGTSCSELIVEIDYSCNRCKNGEYEEAYECKDCGEDFLYDELYEGICIECLKEYLTEENITNYCKHENIYREYLELSEELHSNEEIMEQLDAWYNFAWWLKHKAGKNE